MYSKGCISSSYKEMLPQLRNIASRWKGVSNNSCILWDVDTKLKFHNFNTVYLFGFTRAASLWPAVTLLPTGFLKWHQVPFFSVCLILQLLRCYSLKLQVNLLEARFDVVAGSLASTTGFHGNISHLLEAVSGIDRRVVKNSQFFETLQEHYSTISTSVADLVNDLRTWAL